MGSLSSSMASSMNSLSSSMGSIMATTGSNLFKGNQTISGSIIPSVNNTYDLGSPTQQFRHVYISSGSLYVNGTKVLGSTAQELQITTDAGQSFKILEAGSDTITLQAADGNITLAASGGGDVILDPTTGVIALKGTTTLYAGNKILSSDGNAIQIGNSVTMTGSLIVTGFIETQELRTTYISSSILYRSGSTKFGDELGDTHSFTGSLTVSGSISVPGSGLVSGSSQITYSGLSGVPSGIISGSSQLPSGLVSGSVQVLNGSGVFSGSAQLPSGIVSGSAQVISSLPSGTISGSVQIDVMSTTNIARLATTGSNTFTGNLTLSSSSSTTDLGGVLIVRGNGSAYSTHYLTTGAANVAKYIQYNASGTAINQINAGGDSYITGGNFGIGISSPQGLLDVYKSTSGGLGGHIYLRNNGAAVGNEMAVMFVDGDASTMRAAISSTTEGAPYFGDIKFKTGLGTYASLTTRMTISGEGKVGIGFTPSYKLQVAGEITTHAGTNTSYYAYMNYLGTTYNFASGETTDNVDFKIAGGGAWGSGGNFRWFTQAGGTTPTERFRLTPTGPAYFTNKLTVGGTGNYSSATLSVEGPVRANRSIYNWYQSGTNSWDGYQYLHLKTTLWGGGGGSNSQPTMSMFSAKLYSYSSAYIREGNLAFHNWSGSIYSPATTGTIWYGAYVSSDGYVTLILALGGGSYQGVHIDWHQSFGYGFQDRYVSSTAYTNTASSLY